MLEQFRYVNHMNETLDFGKGKIFVNENDLRDFAWEIKSKNDRISGFKRGIVSKTIPIIIKCNTVEEGIALKNKLFETFEKDVLAVKHGKIIIGDYFLKCFLVESKKSNYLVHGSYIKINAKISTDFPCWYKEHSTTFNYGSGSKGTNLDFKRDFPSDYTSNLLGKRLNNTGLTATNFIMTIHGSCTNPEISIGGHKYAVEALIEKNEYLTIDSQNKTIVLTHSDGTTENYFKKRDRSSYIFEKIPPGTLNVSASSSYKFEVLLLEERSEPKWT